MSPTWTHSCPAPHQLWPTPDLLALELTEVYVQLHNFPKGSRAAFKPLSSKNCGMGPVKREAADEGQP